MPVPEVDAPAPGAILLGCAGWSLSKEVAAPFPPEGSHLERYAALFNAVEINSSFYRPHRPQTYARWAASVPDGFRFSVKLPRSISHQRRLVDADEELQRFAAESGELGEKLGCVLVQLPPSLQFDAAIASAFFTRLRQAFACMLACEARHPSWFGAAATAVLAAHGVSRVSADPPAGQDGPHVPSAPSAYLRLHGSPKIYYSSYSAQYLEQVTRTLRAHAAAGRSAWCIFDNTAAGAAVPNALALLPLILSSPQ